MQFIAVYLVISEPCAISIDIDYQFKWSHDWHGIYIPHGHGYNKTDRNHTQFLFATQLAPMYAR